MEAIDNEQGIKSDSKNPIVYATFIERIGAFVLDFIIMLFPVGILFAYGYLEKSIFMLLLGSITMALYKPLMEGVNGPKIGKKIIGIKMVDDKGENK